MKKYYAGVNSYGTTVSYDYGWSVKVFDTAKELNSWVSENWYNEQGLHTVEPINYNTVRKILGSGIWVKFDGFLINEKDDPRN